MPDRPYVVVNIQAQPDGRLMVFITDRTGGGSTDAQIAGDVTTRDRTTAEPETTDLTTTELMRMRRMIVRMAENDTDLGPEHEAIGRRLYKCLFGGDAGAALDSLRGGKEPLLLKLMVPTQLKGVPWELMRGPTDQEAKFLACSGELQLARGVNTTARAMSADVDGPVNILAVAPEENRDMVEDLLDGLQEVERSNQVKLLEPLIGHAATFPMLQERLQKRPYPHVLHFICHGRAKQGAELLLDPESGAWTRVEAIAGALGESRENLRLIYLESCYGAEPGALSSAADILTAQGVEAVVAHLWKVNADAARDLARDFYSALTGTARGDLMKALNYARLNQLGTSRVEFLCPVLTLRGNDPRVFEFSKRQTVAAAGRWAGGGDALEERLKPELVSLELLLESPSTLVVGEFVDPGGTNLGLHQLQEALQRTLKIAVKKPLHELLLEYEVRQGRADLNSAVELILGNMISKDDLIIPPAIRGLSMMKRGGVVVTLMWMPFVEEALAEHHPDKEILVLQQKEPGAVGDPRVFRRPAGETGWDLLAPMPERLDLEEQFVVLRPYGGFTPRNRMLIDKPILTDDDHLDQMSALSGMNEQLLAYLKQHPFCFAGFSPLSWRHRGLLRQLTDRQPLKPTSLAILGPNDDPREREFWSSKHGIGNSKLKVLAYRDLLAILEAIS